MRALLALVVPACVGTTTPVVEAPTTAPAVDLPRDDRAAWELAAREWNAVTRPERWVAVSWPRLSVGGEVWEVFRGDPGPGLGGWADGVSHRVVVASWIADPFVLLAVVVHEMGHTLGVWEHVPPPAVMANDGPWTVTLTPADVEACQRAGACP